MMERLDIIIEAPPVSSQLLFAIKSTASLSTIVALIAKVAGVTKGHDGLIGNIEE